MTLAGRQEETANDGCPEVAVSLVIGADDLDAGACTAAIGVPPTEVWRQHRRELVGLEGAPSVQWIISREPVRVHTIEAAVRPLVDDVWHVRLAIRRFVESNGCSCFVACTVRVYQQPPLWELSSTLMGRLALIGADFTLDVFDYAADEVNP